MIRSSTPLRERGKLLSSSARPWGGMRVRPCLERLEDRLLLNAGDLDSSFGSGGKVVTNFYNGSDRIDDIAILSNGQILAGGSSTSGPAVVRYNADGSIDTTFGAQGIAATTYGSGRAMAMQPDGKIILAGDQSNVSLSTKTDWVVKRLTASGSLDTTFGTGGRVYTDFGGSDDFLSGVAVQSDGKIVATGFRLLNPGSNELDDVILALQL